MNDTLTTAEPTTGKITLGQINLVVASILFARHGNAPAVADQLDSLRELDPAGKAQAYGLEATLDDMGWMCDLALSSPLVRVMETTRIVAGCEPTPLDCLGITDDQTDALNVMYAALKYAPLITGNPEQPGYFEHPLGEHLKTWARTALNEIWEQAKANPGGRQNIFIGGHAVCLNALIWVLLEQLSDDLNCAEIMDMVATTSLDPANAFCLKFDESQGEGKITCQIIGPTASTKPLD